MPVPDLNAHILDKFGQDLSPEARQKLSDEAERQKHSFSVVGGGLLSGLGDVIAGRRPSDEPLQRKRAQIDEDTTGRFDKAKELVLRDMAASDKLEDRERLRTIQGREDTAYGRGEEDRLKAADPNDPRAGDAREMINFVRKKLGLTDSRLDGLGIDQLSKHPMYDQAVGLWEKEQAAKHQASSQWGPLDATYLGGWQAYINGQANSPPSPEGVSPKAIQQGNQLGSSFQGRKNTQAGRMMTQADKVATKRKFFQDADRTMQNALDAPLNGIGDISALYSFIHNQDDTAAREGELALAQRGASVFERVKQIVGNITDGRLLSDDQRAKIREQLSIMRNGIQQQHRHYLENVKKSADTLGWDNQALVPDYEEFMKQSQVPEVPQAAPALATPQAVAPAGGSVRYQANGKLYNLPAEKVEAFLAKYPDAKKVE